MSAALFAALCWLFLLIAALVGRQSIYRHRRVGLHGRPFYCLKFRSMNIDADLELASVLTSDAAKEEWRRTCKLRDDPRVTAIGKVLRATHLDELPQLVNVLLGDMSLVGPRPITQDELARYGDDARYYLMARPGMTGLWQVSGKADYAERVALDVRYVKHGSLFADLAILCKTPLAILESWALTAESPLHQSTRN